MQTKTAAVKQILKLSTSDSLLVLGFQYELYFLLNIVLTQHCHILKLV